MYVPELFRVEDVAQMHALMRARPFAALVSAGSSGLFASHMPTVVKDDERYGVIECHLARANPHCCDLADGGEALMIFQGAEGIRRDFCEVKVQKKRILVRVFDVDVTDPKGIVTNIPATNRWQYQKEIPVDCMELVDYAIRFVVASYHSPRAMTARR